MSIRKAHAERAARFERIIYQIEDKAGKESFASRRDACLWLSENARGLAACFAVKNGEGGKAKIARKARAVASATAHFG